MTPSLESRGPIRVLPNYGVGCRGSSFVGEDPRPFPHLSVSHQLEAGGVFCKAKVAGGDKSRSLEQRQHLPLGFKGHSAFLLTYELDFRTFLRDTKAEIANFSFSSPEKAPQDRFMQIPPPLLYQGAKKQPKTFLKKIIWHFKQQSLGSQAWPCHWHSQ